MQPFYPTINRSLVPPLIPQPTIHSAAWYREREQPEMSNLEFHAANKPRLWLDGFNRRIARN